MTDIELGNTIFAKLYLAIPDDKEKREVSKNIHRFVKRAINDARLDEGMVIAVGLISVLEPEQYKKFLTFMGDRKSMLTKEEL